MENILNQLFVRYPKLENVEKPIRQAAEMLIETFRNNGKVLVCGNGGSSADAGHIAGELMKSFE
ncbi:MAG: SIS domain-containing protein, partial [Bacteroidales bacterium]|nr:SIS domain-containing protein [Bacteroidales bacterium]